MLSRQLLWRSMCGQSPLCWQHPDAAAHALIRQMGLIVCKPLCGILGHSTTSWTGKPCSLRCIVCSKAYPIVQTSGCDRRL